MERDSSYSPALRTELEESVLGGPLRPSLPVARYQQQAVDHARIAVVELLESAHILLEKPPRKCRIGRHVAICDG